MGNDGDPVPQDVRLIHVVRGEDDGAACRAQTQGHGTGEAGHPHYSQGPKLQK